MAQKKITDLTLRSDFDTTCNIPVDDAVQTYRITGAQLLTFVKGLVSQYDGVTNLSLVTSVAASALTIAVKTLAAGNPSSTDPISVAMRSATLTSGAYAERSLTSALSLVISSGSTLGQVSALPALIYVYLIDNAGTLELAASHSYYPEDSLVSTTAEGGAGAADSVTAIYSTVARTSVAIRLIGTILNTQTTAGTWASAGTQVQLTPKQSFKAPTVQKFTSGSGTYNTPAGVKYLTVEMVGGGGGGASGGTVGAAGSAGVQSSFGTGLLVASPGNPGTTNGGGTGGSYSLGAAIGTGLTGGGGGGAGYGGTNAVPPGGAGGNSAFGGGGFGTDSGAGGVGAANTGGGGAGGNTNSVTNTPSGGGGGSGGYVNAIILTPNATYAYAVGTGGAGGAGSVAGMAGAAGYIEVREFYN